MKWNELTGILKEYYVRNGLASSFPSDEEYLRSAYEMIEKLWMENLNAIKGIKYVMLAEAPLWGCTQKYIYNPDTENTQFFYRSDLEHALNQPIKSKRDFLCKLIEIGLVIIDISPFALNEVDTAVNYRNMTKSNYRELVSMTLPIYFSERLNLIRNKMSQPNRIFFRYKRVKDTFGTLVAPILIQKGFIYSENDISSVSQKGGNINKNRLKDIMHFTI